MKRMFAWGVFWFCFPIAAVAVFGMLAVFFPPKACAGSSRQLFPGTYAALSNASWSI